MSQPSIKIISNNSSTNFFCFEGFPTFYYEKFTLCKTLPKTDSFYFYDGT